MIKSIKIKNFQSHKDSELTFDKGVNVIVGSSDSGKTAIIRALRWVIFNKPNGDFFRSHWGGDTSVVVETETNTIQRSKGKGGNVYMVDDAELKAFGANVPQTVSDAFNMSEVNLKQQSDSHFLLNDTSGKVASFFNSIAHFEQIDIALQKINSDISKLKRGIEYDKATLKESKEELKKYDFLDSFESELLEVEKKQVKLEQIQQDITTIANIIFLLEAITSNKRKYSKLIFLKDNVDLVLSKYNKLKGVNTNKDTLQHIVTNINNIQNSLLFHNRLFVLKEPVINLLAKITAEANLHSKFKRLQKLYENVQQLKKDSLKQRETVLRLSKQFHDKMGDTCPLCGNNLK